LKGRLLKSKALPGQRKILPDRAHPACPLCGEFIRMGELHPAEKRAMLVVFLGVVLIMGAIVSPFPRIVIPAAAVFALVAALWAVYVTRNKTDGWQRYVSPYKP
jgi:hypothetical protein